jgi:hypothetical protein
MTGPQKLNPNAKYKTIPSVFCAVSLRCQSHRSDIKDAAIAKPTSKTQISPVANVRDSAGCTLSSSPWASEPTGNWIGNLLVCDIA